MHQCLNVITAKIELGCENLFSMEIHSNVLHVSIFQDILSNVHETQPWEMDYVTAVSCTLRQSIAGITGQTILLKTLMIKALKPFPSLENILNISSGLKSIWMHHCGTHGIWLLGKKKDCDCETFERTLVQTYLLFSWQRYSGQWQV